jgi:hypothetical protein
LVIATKPKPTQTRSKAPKPPKVTMEAIVAESARVAAQPTFDRNAYQREYMRKRRSKAKG